MSDCTHDYIEDWQDYCPDCGLPAVEVAEARELIRLRHENARMKDALQKVQRHRDELISGQRSAANATLRKKARDDRRHIRKQAAQIEELQRRLDNAANAIPDGWMVIEEWPKSTHGASGEVYAWPAIAHESINDLVASGVEGAARLRVRPIVILRQPGDPKP